MHEALDIRLDEAEKNKLGYVEFLTLLVEDEIARRATRSLASRIEKARFEERKTVEDFDFAFNPEIPQKKIRDLATCRYLDAGEGVLIYGPVGTGKTHVAQALGHAACRRGYAVRFVKTERLLGDLGGGHADGTWDARVRKYLAPDLLILDDFLMRALTPLQGDDLYELIGERIGRGATIITSNRAPKDWYGLFPNPVVAESLLDRLINASHHVVMKGKSHRPEHRPDKNEPTAKASAAPDEPATKRLELRRKRMRRTR